ncbi:patatin-like phospholipase family protein [Roseofilum casamattae]|uniref:Patatin-like phospholipase family protein n=1 Tax=Roseofilum casamattae BLCC-M143 TaxID=3022442 RepID=A0ABT7C240_9CYAN|nr:patatin-like phospholipase family protein [Roseofilum casamattae]MDJ1185518.1 patatin-like phospholipase family protein [Roseofilum casamattae BLCC-M143]
MSQNNDSNQPKFKILSLDGGGVRSTGTAQMLKALEEELRKKTGDPDKRIGQCFDLITGVSAGSILAAGLALNKTADELIYFCRTRWPEIFDKKYKQKENFAKARSKKLVRSNLPLDLAWDAFGLDGLYNIGWSTSKSKLKSFKSQLEKDDKKAIKAISAGLKAPLYGPKYSNEGLIEVLQEFLEPDVKLSDINPETPYPELLILAYDTAHRHTTFFHSHPRLYNGSDNIQWFEDLPLWKVCVASAAAPLYLPPYLLKSTDPDQKEYPHLDGAIGTNCPALAALGHAMLKRGPKDITVLSMGTGNVTRPVEYEEIEKWTAFDWAEPGNMFNFALGGQVQLVTDLCGQMLDSVHREIKANYKDEAYLRLQFPMNQSTALQEEKESSRESTEENNNFRQPLHKPRQGKFLPKDKQVNQYIGERIPEEIDNVKPKTIKQLRRAAREYIKEKGCRQKIREFLEYSGTDKYSNNSASGSGTE